MSLAILLVAAAVVGLAIIFRLAAARSLQLRRQNPPAVICPVDLEAFRNLMDPREDRYLRRHLRARQFRSVRRERLRAAAAYVRVVAGNASVLVQVGQAAIAAGDPRLSGAAHELVNSALLLRRNTTVALARIYFAIAWPYSEFAAAPVADRYERLSGAAMLLGRLQNPAAPVRLLAQG
ncbi:MAG TPA: hypothetical protein VND65_02350 [Candidatus Binatia bacterium]|nr:hypothetical protein [Candidatus Binatia bacterium]